MSNNGNNNQTRSQPVTAVAGPTASSQKESDPAAQNDPQKSAIQTCLRILLRAATMGSVSRSHEDEIKAAIASLE